MVPSYMSKLFNFFHWSMQVLSVVFLWYKVNLSPFRFLIMKYNGSKIPLMAWSPALCALFDQIKLDLSFDLCLAGACSSTTFFLKIDWSSAGMGWILMQPNDSPGS